MATWKKVIVSGSIAELNQVTASGGFSGDGSGLTGIVVGSMAADSIDSDQYVNGSIDTAHYAAGSVDATALASNAVTTAKINNDAVTAAKLASNAVVNASIASNAAIAHTKLAALASTKLLVGNGSNVATAVVLSGDVAMDNAGEVTIQADSVTYDMMQDTSTANRLLGAASAGTIGEVQVVVGMMAADSIDSDQYVNGSIDTAHYAAGSVDATALASNAVTTAKINADAVTGAKIADEAIDSDHYVDGSIDTAHIADNQITGDKLADSFTVAANLTVAGNLIVQGATTEVQTTNLNVEDQFILLNSGSVNKDTGIIFGGTHGTANTGKALLWDHAANHGGGADGRLAVKTNATAANNTTAFASGSTGYYLAGVFQGSTADAATALADHAGNIRIESNELFMYF